LPSLWDFCVPDRGCACLCLNLYILLLSQSLQKKAQHQCQ
jgi:hypothetical protein